MPVHEHGRQLTARTADCISVLRLWRRQKSTEADCCTQDRHSVIRWWWQWLCRYCDAMHHASIHTFSSASSRLTVATVWDYWRRWYCQTFVEFLINGMFLNGIMYRHTAELFRRETSDTYIPQDLWPSNSPDLNPVDYSVWDIYQERVYQTGICQAWQNWSCRDC